MRRNGQGRAGRRAHRHLESPEQSVASYAEAVDVQERIRQAGATLTRSERRVAEVLLGSPEVVAFGTVAELAAAADAGAATVVRLATKLGFEGFTDLQARVQSDLAQRLRPAAERIRNPLPDDLLGRVTQLELDNVQATLAGVERGQFDTAVAALSDLTVRVHVLSGDAERGIAQQFLSELSVLRPGVSLLGGNQVGLARQIALLDDRDVLVAVDLRRYERWVLDTADAARRRGVRLIAISDSPLSPLHGEALAGFVVRAGGAGPFDSHVGTLALFNAVIAACAGLLRDVAQDRIDRIEAAWSAADALIEP